MGTDASQTADRVARALARPYFGMLHRLRCSGVGNVPASGPALLVANHQSFYDPAIIALAAGRHVTYLAWDYYVHMPVVGHGMRLFHPVAVNLDRPGPSAIEGLVQALQQGELCGIFPEGGRTPDGLLQPAYAGVAAVALRTGASMVPVTISGAYRAWPHGALLPRPAPIALHFGEPMLADEVAPDTSSTERRREVTRRIMERIAAGFATLGRPELARANLRRLADAEIAAGPNPP